MFGIDSSTQLSTYTHASQVTHPQVRSMDLILAQKFKSSLAFPGYRFSFFDRFLFILSLSLSLSTDHPIILPDIPKQNPESRVGRSITIIQPVPEVTKPNVPIQYPGPADVSLHFDSHRPKTKILSCPHPSSSRSKVKTQKARVQTSLDQTKPTLAPKKEALTQSRWWQGGSILLFPSSLFLFCLFLPWPDPVVDTRFLPCNGPLLDWLIVDPVAGLAVWLPRHEWRWRRSRKFHRGAGMECTAVFLMVRSRQSKVDRCEQVWPVRECTYWPRYLVFTTPFHLPTIL